MCALLQVKVIVMPGAYTVQLRPPHFPLVYVVWQLWRFQSRTKFGHVSSTLQRQR